MTDEFKKARDETAIKNYGYNLESNLAFKDGWNAAYELMLNTHCQFALHRVWIKKHDTLLVQAEELAEAFEYCVKCYECHEDPADFKQALARWLKFRGEKS